MVLQPTKPREAVLTRSSTICIGPLVPEPAHVAGGRAPMTALARMTIMLSRRTGSTNKTDIEATAGSHHRARDVLVVKACGHAFHAGCLRSWFLQGASTCPLCRENAPLSVPDMHRLGFELVDAARTFENALWRLVYRGDV